MQKINIKLQKLKIEDLPDLSQFAKKSFTDTFKGTCTDDDLEYFLDTTYNIEKLTEEFNDPQSEVWIYINSDQIIGFIKLNFEAPVPYPKTGIGLEIQRLYIAKELSGRGLGRSLMKHAENIAREKNYGLLWLGVYEFNEPAKGFYEGLGFKYFGSHPFPLGGTPQIDLWMIKYL